MRCNNCIHKRVCFYKEEFTYYDKDNDCEYFEPRSILGEWIPIKSKKGEVVAYECNICHKNPKHALISPYCPNCGNKMKS